MWLVLFTLDEVKEITNKKIPLQSVLGLDIAELDKTNNKLKFSKTIEKVENGFTNYYNESGKVVFSDLGFEGVARVESQRTTLFKEKGTKCACCGLEASYFKKTSNVPFKRLSNDRKEKVTFHVNLMGVRNGKEVLFTKDHVKPKFKKGENNLDNYETSCSTCNFLKNSLEISMSELREIIKNKPIEYLIEQREQNSKKIMTDSDFDDYNEIKNMLLAQ